MAAQKIVSMTLEEVRASYVRGDLFLDSSAPEGPDLGAEFWADAILQKPNVPKDYPAVDL